MRARPNRSYILEPECYACGARYVAATFVRRTGPHRGERVRAYTHPVPAGKMNDEQAQRTIAAGCKHWYIDADALEASVRDVILEQRTGPEFGELLSHLLAEQGSVNAQAAALETAAEQRVKDLERKRDNLRAQLEDAADVETRRYLLERVTELTREISAATQSWVEARERRNVAAGMNDEILSIVEQTENIEATWNQPGPSGVEARRAIVDAWVDHLLVEVLPDADRVRGLTRRVYVFLRTLPETPVTFDLTQPMDGNRSSAWCRSMGWMLLTTIVVEIGG